MNLQRNLKWPTRRESIRLNKIIYETNINPFGLAQYNPNRRVSDFVGRREELAKLKAQLNLVFHNKLSRAVRLEGPGGVGKSTLFNYLKESIESERIDENPRTQYLLRNTDIFSTYFIIPDKIFEFSDIWIPLMDGLRPGFEIEVGIDISLPEYIAFLFVYKMFLNNPEQLSEIIWDSENRPHRLDHVELRDIIRPLMRKGKIAVKAIQDYYTENKLEIREKFKTEIYGNSYELKRADNRIIQDLFRVIDEDDPNDYLELILTASNQLYRSNDELITYFDNLMRYYACLTKKQPLLLIGIDEAAKFSGELPEDYFYQLGLLFVRLRDSLNYVLFVFISTTTDWAEFDRVINLNSDLESQISEFMYTLPLKQLSIEDVKQVFINRMNRFWENYSSERFLMEPNYPFSLNLFEYVYRYKRRDLRESIHFLRDIWVNFGFTKRIPKFESKFECMREVLKYDNKAFNPENLRIFDWQYIREAFNDSLRYRSPTTRSSAVEIGLENAWKCLTFENPPTVTDVKNNPVIKTSTGKKRRPDVYVQLLGNLGAEYRRYVEFQVKAYGPNEFIRLDKIKSSLQLFDEGYTDFIYFIITGKGLDSNAEQKVKELEQNYPNRIRRPSLTLNQENILYLLALYEEVSGKKLGDDPNKDIILSKKLLNDVLGQRIESFLMEIKNLAYRGREERTIISEPMTIPSLSTPEPSRITDYVEEIVEEDLFELVDSSEIELDRQRSHIISWINTYPALEPYKYEVCGLCMYLKQRERGSDKFKFYKPTVIKNVIIQDASYSKINFENLIDYLNDNDFIIPDKRSFRLTELGEKLYWKIKDNNYQC
ncbi:MAG: ATP-binding protein [Promethearchaeota archaeon]